MFAYMFAYFLFLLLIVETWGQQNNLRSNIEKNMKKWKAVGSASKFIARTKLQVAKTTGSLSNQAVTPETDSLRQQITAAINALRAQSNMLALDNQGSVIAYQTQVVNGMKHCLCITTNQPKNDLENGHVASEKKLHFKACWVDSSDDQQEPYLESVIPSSVIMKAQYDAIEMFRCTASTPLIANTAEESNTADSASSNLLELIEKDLRPLPMPTEYDFRTAYPECTPIVEELYDQASCGSCYAFASVSAAAARACAAGHTIESKKLSVNDPLACGTRMSGSICVAMMGGTQTTNYANGCDGGQSSLVNDYAVDHGLIEAPCHKYIYSGDPTTHWSPDLECRLHNHNEGEQKITCKDGRYIHSILLPSTNTVLVDQKWCTCRKEDRSGFDKVEVIVAAAKTTCKMRKLVDGAAKIICNDGMLINHAMSVKDEDPIGSNYNFGEDGMMYCRCAHTHLTMEPPNAFHIYENGKDATDYETCRRSPTGRVSRTNLKALENELHLSCRAKDIFHSAMDASEFTSELVMKHAIIDGGPIVASLQAYDDLSKYKEGTIYSRSPTAKPSGGHAIVLFGWGVEKGEKFWWAKNSWGKHATKIFKYKRGSNEGDIEKRGVTWLYAKKTPSQQQKIFSRDSNPLFCPRALMSKNEPQHSSCLQLHETPGEIGGIVDVPSSCHVTNVCTEGIELPEIQYSLMLKSTKSTCGRKFFGDLVIVVVFDF